MSYARFADYRDRHRGETVLVCGCGVSLRQLSRPDRFVTIGVNDVGRRFTPDYLMVVNERRQFAPERYAHVLASEAKAVFSQLDLPHPRTVRFKLGTRAGTARPTGDRLDYASNSPYVAINLARYMGAARIGLIGVDFDDHHFFAATGRHPLAAQLPQIDREYAALAAACETDGTPLVNLSPNSRLTSLTRASLATWPDSATAPRRVFFVHYRFLSCGTVFDTGLREAGATLGLTSEHADWDDVQLPAKIERFRPDLVFVVHGRRFVQRWGDRFAKYRSAVWLLDEPYEVDDTSRWSRQFDVVLLNDGASAHRHVNAHELPVAYAPSLHHDAGGAARRWRRAGFIGGVNPARERLLGTLAGRGLLDYVVGGPWRDPRLNALCLSGNIPAERTAALYRETDVVVNVFRDRHHFNASGIEARTMNPRIYEALACGALVISEPREEIARLLPELPTFRTAAEAAELVDFYGARPEERMRVQQACRTRLAGGTYAERLRTTMDIVFAPGTHEAPRPVPPAPIDLRPLPREGVVPFDDDWDDIGGVVRRATDGNIVIEASGPRASGAERGLTSRSRFDAIDLTFEACLGAGACLLAKVHQADPIDQTSNSYHLYADERRAYLARHHHVFRQFESPRLGWTRFRLVCSGGMLSLWRNDRLLHRVRDQMLNGGFAFLGAQGGSVRVRALRVSPAGAARDSSRARDQVDELVAIATPPPRLSIITTVYDRVDCLRRCLASVQRLRFADFEHIVVADHPPADVLERIRASVMAHGDPRRGLCNLTRRFNNWGIAPAAVGLRRARGEYVAFLSDDNGYTADHFDPLVSALDRETRLGFVYSSCRYDGRLVLNHPVPRPGRIDLGQPLFRRELFELYLGDDLPFDMMAWDWHLIDALMRHGVRWRHVDRQSFIFRLEKYPHEAAAAEAAAGVSLT